MSKAGKNSAHRSPELGGISGQVGNDPKMPNAISDYLAVSCDGIPLSASPANICVRFPSGVFANDLSHLVLSGYEKSKNPTGEEFGSFENLLSISEDLVVVIEAWTSLTDEAKKKILAGACELERGMISRLL